MTIIKKYTQFIKEDLDDKPGNAEAHKQFHVFDFDDTLGVTNNPNGIMPYKDGQPLLKNAKSATKWVVDNGLENYLLAPKGGKSIEQIGSRGGFAIYLSSAGLAYVQSAKNFSQFQQIVLGSKGDDEKISDPKSGEILVIDFTPSSFVDADTTKPILSTIDKLKNVNSRGGKTSVMTARQGEGPGENFEGETVNVTNTDDINKFLSAKGAKPNVGVIGVKGVNKGEELIKKLDQLKPEPEEIHFYDDLSKNTTQVADELKKQTDKEVYIYGPGHFDKGEVDVNKPDRKLAAAAKPVAQSEDDENKEELVNKESMILKFKNFRRY